MPETRGSGSRFPAKYLRGAANLSVLYWRRNSWRYHPDRFQGTWKGVQIRRPIFILGVQGGGLTLLARMLRRNFKVVSVTGNSNYWAGPDEMQNVMGSFLPPELTGLHYDIPPDPRYPDRDWLYAIDDLLPLYRKTTIDASPAIAEKFRQAIQLSLAIHAHDPSQARFVDKSQTFTVRLSLIATLLEKATPQFVLVTRNPFAACFRAAFRSTSLVGLDEPLDKKIALACQHWSNSYQCALEDSLALPFVKTIRFEDLLQDPEHTLRDISNFLGLDFSPTMLPAESQQLPLGSTGSSGGDHKWYPLRPNVNEQYLHKLERWMVELIESRVSHLAKRWSYTPSGP